MAEWLISDIGRLQNLEKQRINLSEKRRSRKFSVEKPENIFLNRRR
jgi:hypothetical protein